MKKLILLFLILVLAGCAAEPLKPSKQERDAAISNLMQCLASNITSVDDGTSDASTIARSLVSLCNNKFHEVAYIHVKNENERVQQIFYKKSEQSNLDIALTYVLRYRNSKKVK